LKQDTLRQMLARHPDRPIREAVKGMLPHNRLGDDMMNRLKIYGGAEHPHAAQKPIPWAAPKAGDYADIVREPVPARVRPSDDAELDEETEE
jgi:large subunit ribosomal protein L13